MATQITAGCRFGFRAWPRWQFWKHGIGVARVVAVDRDLAVAHVQVLAIGPAPIAHLPILLRSAQPYARGIVPDPDAVTDEQSLTAIREWRRERSEGRAGVFAVPLHEAVRAVYTTVTGMPEGEYIENAYPVPGDDGKFKTVRVVTSPST